jgi:uncharacterized protein (DUF1800 family)
MSQVVRSRPRRYKGPRLLSSLARMRTDDELCIAHLHRRAGFGLSPEELKSAAAKGFDACVEELLHPEKIKDPLEERLTEMQGELFDLSSLEDAQAWWLYRMIHTRRPLEEKMTLFWHGHFATANSKVDNPRLMVRQNRLFREHALGKFKELLLGVSRDPAMILWLDNGLSSKKHPNENFGRELMELFTLGIGHYTETEVREVARAFTGWKQRDGEFSYDEKDHDDGPKTFLGQTWAWSGEEVLDALARHPATAEHLAGALVRFFVSDEGDADMEKEVARTYLESGGDLRACVGWILRSPGFRDERAIRARVKSPVELAVGAIRELHSTLPVRALPGAITRMGQALFNPPVVKGWDGGLAWINTATLFERGSFANLLVTERGAKGDNWFDPGAWVAKDADAKTAVATFVDALLDGRISDCTRAALEDYLPAEDKDGKPVPFKAGPQQLDQKVRGLVRLIVSSPEYQLA